jgi:hypothetical protein
LDGYRTYQITFEGLKRGEGGLRSDWGIGSHKWNQKLRSAYVMISESVPEDLQDEKLSEWEQLI